jgi:hypothetical protein
MTPVPRTSREKLTSFFSAFLRWNCGFFGGSLCASPGQIFDHFAHLVGVKSMRAGPMIFGKDRPTSKRQ